MAKSEAAAVWVDIGVLVPWDKNPRLIGERSVADVAASIKRFGFASPIIARKSDNMVIAGHTRLQAAGRLGLDKVPVRYMDLDPGDAALLALADNRTGEHSAWSDGLTSVLQDLADDEFNIDGLGLGWKDDELKVLLEPTAMGAVSWKQFDETIAPPLPPPGPDDGGNYVPPEPTVGGGATVRTFTCANCGHQSEL